MLIEDLKVQIQIDIAKATANLKAIQTQTQGMMSSFRNASKSVIKDTDKLSNAIMKSSIAWGSWKVISGAVKYVAEMESQLMSFSVKLGSVTRATRLYGDVVQLAARTPLNLPEITKSVNQMLAYGTSVSKVVDVVRMLGDVSTGVGAGLEDVAWVYGTMQATGRVVLRDLYQLGTRGIPILQELSKNLKTDTAGIMELSRKGALSLGDMERAFRSMTNEGGMFHDMLARQSKTLKGLYSTLIDTKDLALVDVFKPVTESLKGLVKASIEFIDSNKLFAQAIGLVIDLTVGTFIGVIKDMFIVFSVLPGPIRGATGLILAFVASFSGVVWVVALLAKLQLRMAAYKKTLVATFIAQFKTNLEILKTAITARLAKAGIDGVSVSTSWLGIKSAIAKVGMGALTRAFLSSLIPAKLSMSAILGVGKSLLTLTGYIGWAVLAVVTLIEVFGSLYDMISPLWKKPTNEAEIMSDALKDQAEAMKDLEDSMQGVDDTGKKLTKTWKDMYEEVFASIKEDKPLLGKGIVKENIDLLIRSYEGDLAKVRERDELVRRSMGLEGKPLNEAERKRMGDLIGESSARQKTRQGVETVALLLTELEYMERIAWLKQQSFEISEKMNGLLDNYDKKILEILNKERSLSELERSGEKFAFQNDMREVGIVEGGTDWNHLMGDFTLYYKLVDAKRKEQLKMDVGSFDVSLAQSELEKDILSNKNDLVKAEADLLVLNQRAVDEKISGWDYEKRLAALKKVYANNEVAIYKAIDLEKRNIEADMTETELDNIQLKYDKELENMKKLGMTADSIAIKAARRDAELRSSKLKEDVEAVEARYAIGISRQGDQLERYDLETEQGVYTLSLKKVYADMLQKQGDLLSSEISLLNSKASSEFKRLNTYDPKDRYDRAVYDKALAEYDKSVSEMKNMIGRLRGIREDMAKNGASVADIKAFEKERALGRVPLEYDKNIAKYEATGDIGARLLEEKKKRDKFVKEMYGTDQKVIKKAGKISVDLYFDEMEKSFLERKGLNFLKDTGVGSLVTNVGSAYEKYSDKDITPGAIPLDGVIAGIATAMRDGGKALMEGMGSVVSMVIDTLVKIAEESKHFKMIISFLTDILSYLLPDIDAALGPVLDLMYAFSPTLKSLGSVLIDVVKVLIKTVTWVYDYALMPFGNFIIDVANGYIGLWNATLGGIAGYIGTLSHLVTSAEGAALAAIAEAEKDAQKKLKTALSDLVSTIEDASSKLRESIDGVSNLIKDKLGSQLKSLKDLYDVGAITAGQLQSRSSGMLDKERDNFWESGRIAGLSDQQVYDTWMGIVPGIAEGKSLADLWLELAVLVKQNSVLLEFSARLVDLQASVGKEDYGAQLAGFNAWKSGQSSLSGYTIPAAPAAPAAPVADPRIAEYNAVLGDTFKYNPRSDSVELIRASIRALGGTPAYAMGSSYIPNDTFANIHEGEMVIPKPFAASLRSGEMSLSKSGGDNITINVYGSVLEENNLADTLAKKIDQRRRRGYVTT